MLQFSFKQRDFEQRKTIQIWNRKESKSSNIVKNKNMKPYRYKHPLHACMLFIHVRAETVMLPTKAERSKFEVFGRLQFGENRENCRWMFCWIWLQLMEINRRKMRYDTLHGKSWGQMNIFSSFLSDPWAYSILKEKMWVETFVILGQVPQRSRSHLA